MDGFGRCSNVTDVAVTMRSIREPATNELRDSLSRDWTEYLDKLGFDVIPILNGLSDPVALFEHVSPDALLLTNGEDVGSHPPRDQTEQALLNAAIEASIPILGVCRGHQFINTYYGGDLTNLNEHMNDPTTHVATNHDVQIQDSPIELPDTLSVNSYHEMAVSTSDTASVLKPFATSDSGSIVEGLYHPKQPILSMQWHPERDLPDREAVDDLVAGFLQGEHPW
ncbi:peptidase C26 [Haloferax elongans ATCC BAA-1513]|uniref:anthranilate synthase n=1 Tax=Haloferax elongans ATCC BAA-1513 TaxID=1230453 RepID=M0H9D8_HALEO|nr:gamma-glutamyl-gamma-aminobutyrate hydrolase family protein [Haloferax elongans]ELZ81075.1 peptidase C26 [Haloferax elongans ATCC BAA-1513]